MKDEQVQGYFEMLGLDTSHVWELFRSLDADHNGMIALDELVTGCFHLRGAAKVLDVNRLSIQTDELRKTLEGIVLHIDRHMLAIESLLTDPKTEA